MRFPRFLFNSKARLLYQDLQRERRANTRLRRELLEWQNKFLNKVNTAPLFQPPSKPMTPIPQPPIGPTAKKAALAARPDPNHVPTAEEILSQAARVNGNQ